MNTKKDEKIITSSDIDELNGKYLAERLVRKWSEDFVDEETGEAVSIERKELLFERGTKLDNEVLPQINFMLQSGDISSVVASNQERKCTRTYGNGSLWQVQVMLNSKKKTLYLYASSVEMAMAVATDYIEQKYDGRFDFVLVKELDYSNLLHDEDIENDGSLETYRMEIEMVENDDSYKQSYVVQGTDAEHCKNIINTYIVNQRTKAGKPVDFELTIISAKTIPCHDIIDPEFCKSYLEDESFVTNNQ